MFMIYGLWVMGYGLWFMVYGLWFMVYGLGFRVKPVLNWFGNSLAIVGPPPSKEGVPPRRFSSASAVSILRDAEAKMVRSAREIASQFTCNQLGFKQNYYRPIIHRVSIQITTCLLEYY